MAREDRSYVRLTVAYNAIVEAGLDAKLPADLQGDAIPQQILQHEAAVTGAASASSTESGTQSKGGAVYRKTERMLSRVRNGVLSAFEDPEDPRIDELGPLGIGENQTESQVRLANIAEKIRPHVAAGTIALVADLQPDLLAAQAADHAAINKAKATAIKDRQVDRKTLDEERADSRKMLDRIEGFIVAMNLPLVNFGFDLPIPPKRPRLKKGEPDPIAP